MDFHIILTLQSLLCLLCNLREDFENETQGFRNAFAVTAPGHLTLPWFSSALTQAVLGDAFVLLMRGQGVPRGSQDRVGGDQSCDILFRQFVSLGRETQDPAKGADPTGIAVLVTHRHTNFDVNTYYWSYTHVLILNTHGMQVLKGKYQYLMIQLQFSSKDGAGQRWDSTVISAPGVHSTSALVMVSSVLSPCVCMGCTEM